MEVAAEIVLDSPYVLIGTPDEIAAQPSGGVTVACARVREWSLDEG